MTDRTYPALPEGLGLKLRAIEQLMEFDPGYLAGHDCPYGTDLQLYLRRLVGPARAGKEDLTAEIFQKDQDDGEQTDSLIFEIQNALNSMKRLQREMENSTDTTEKLTFLKNYGALMDKFLALKAQAHGVKQMYEFQRIVIHTMEQVLDKDGRLDFKQKLKDANISSP